MDFDSDLVAELKRAHGAHTIIVYGSLARGDATPESDIDVAAFADVTETSRDARLWNGRYLDGNVYPTAVMASSEVDLLKLVGGHIILDERQLAGPFLARLDALERAGPAPLPETELRMRRVWAHKMLARIERGDVEAHYRHHWLLLQLLEDYYALRGTWYRGPKLAFQELRRDAPATFAAFEHALAPGAPLSALAALVERVERVGP